MSGEACCLLPHHDTLNPFLYTKKRDIPTSFATEKPGPDARDADGDEPGVGARFWGKGEETDSGRLASWILTPRGHNVRLSLCYFFQSLEWMKPYAEFLLRFVYIPGPLGVSAKI